MPLAAQLLRAYAQSNCTCGKRFLTTTMVFASQRATGMSKKRRIPSPSISPQKKANIHTYIYHCDPLRIFEGTRISDKPLSLLFSRAALKPLCACVSEPAMPAKPDVERGIKRFHHREALPGMKRHHLLARLGLLHSFQPHTGWWHPAKQKVYAESQRKGRMNGPFNGLTFLVYQIERKCWLCIEHDYIT